MLYRHKTVSWPGKNSQVCNDDESLLEKDKKETSFLCLLADCIVTQHRKMFTTHKNASQLHNIFVVMVFLLLLCCGFYSRSILQFFSPHSWTVSDVRANCCTIQTAHNTMHFFWIWDVGMQKIFCKIIDRELRGTMLDTEYKPCTALAITRRTGGM